MTRRPSPASIEAEEVRSGRTGPHYARVLIRLLCAHALAEKLTARGYERALVLVQDPELRPVLEKNAAEERRHATLLYSALAELGVSESAADRSLVALLKAPSFEAPRHFAERSCDELDLAMASLSLDMTGMIMIGVNYRDSSYAPHARAAQAILDEEAEHGMFAMERVAAAVECGGRERVNAALREWLPRAVNFFGPPGTGFTYDCLRFGLKAKDNGELGELYLAMVGRRLQQLGLTMPKLTAEYPHAAL